MIKPIRNIYIHLPFCKKKCSFCDFSVYAIGNSSNHHVNNHTQTLYKNYIETLIKEVRYIGRKYPQLFNQIPTDVNSKKNSIYFGGGTPSLLPAEYIELILNEIKQITNFNFSDTEISLETDPGTFDDNKLLTYHQLGINRITMGVQSLDPAVLVNLNRSHSLDETKMSLEIINRSKFRNSFGIDFIHGLPNQDLNSIKRDFEYLSKYIIPHLSIYMLSLEKNSSLFKKYDKVYKSTTKQEEIADMFIWTYNYLKEKYDHYEISNYAFKKVQNVDPVDQCNNYLPHNNHSIHNTSYWDGFSNFYGFGSSASSFFCGNRFKKPKSIKKYFKFVDDISNDDNYFDNYMRNINDSSELNEDGDYTNDHPEVKELKYVLLNQIRTKNGINLSQINCNFSKYSPKILQFFEDLKNDNYLGKYIRTHYLGSESYVSVEFTEGILLSDEILVRLFIFAFN